MALDPVQWTLAFLVPYRFGFATTVHVDDRCTDIRILGPHRAAYQQLHLMAGQWYHFAIEALDHATNFFAGCKGFFTGHHAHTL